MQDSLVTVVEVENILQGAAIKTETTWKSVLI